MPSQLEERLLLHQNPEQSRQFRPEHWLASRDYLSQLAREPWLKSRARILHVVGSNGKGSTAHYLACLLQQQGWRVGLYTSPHLLTPHERLCINAQPITDQVATRALTDLKSKLGSENFQRLSYFEILTVLALYYFKQQSCDWIVLEAGLGGRLDATRMAAGSEVVLTGIDLEHSAVLGNTHRQILAEKLGMLTRSTRRLFLPECTGQLSHAELSASLEQVCAQNKIDRSQLEVHYYQAFPGATYLERNRRLAHWLMQTISAGQQETALAPEACPPPAGRLQRGVWQIAATPATPDLKRGALEDNLSEPGRLIETGSKNKITAIFDTAHNPAALTLSLRDICSLPDFPGEAQCLIVLGLLKDRSIADCLQAIADAGFQRCLLLQSDELAPAAQSDSSGATTSATESIALQLQHCPAQAGDLQSLLQNEDTMKWVVMLGSHRHYSLFKELDEPHA